MESKPRPLTPGEILVEAVCRAKALEHAVATPEGVIFVWAANSAEQLEAAIAELGWELKPAEKHDND